MLVHAKRQIHTVVQCTHKYNINDIDRQGETKLNEIYLQLILWAYEQNAALIQLIQYESKRQFSTTLLCF